MGDDSTSDFTRFVDANGARLHRTAVLLTGAAVATLAAVGVGVGTAAAFSSGDHRDDHTATPFAGATGATGASTATDPSSTADPVPATPPQGLDTSSAYAVLHAPGWRAPTDNVISDEKLYYVQDGTDASVSLSWRPGPSLGPTYTVEQEQAELDARYGGQVVVATTTIDGDAAHVFGDHGSFTVVGPIRHGRFLTLTCSGLDLQQVTELATHVHRQEPKHRAGQLQ